MAIFGAVLKDRRVIALGGPRDEQVGFLNALLSNDIRRVTPEQMVYAALLTPQGKYLADMLVFEEGGLRLDADAAQAPDLIKRLTMYRLRRPVTLEMTDAAVSAFWGDSPPGLPDPRDPALGTRFYGAPDLGSAAPGDYEAHRLSLGVPASGRDLIPNDGYILEAGFERLNGVDFRKGCYVGQEIVARMKHKTELRRALLPVALEGEAPEGVELFNSEGKSAGFLRSHHLGRGLAELRLDRIGGPLTTLEGARVTPLR